MLKSSLLEIIRTFTPKELIKFEDFVNSPYFNKNKNVLNLFNEIKKYAPEFKDENLDKELVWKKTFPDREYNYGIMKNIIHDLTKLAEQYIKQLKFGKDGYKQNEYFMSELAERGLHKLYITKIKTLSTKPDLPYLNANNLSICDHFNYIHRLIYGKFAFYQYYDPNQNLYDTMKMRDSALISGFFIHLFQAFNDVNTIGVHLNVDLANNPVIKLINVISPALEEIIDTLEVDPAYIKIYQKVYFTLKDLSEDRFLDFKKTLFDNVNLLPKYDIKDLHINLRNSTHVLKKEKLNLSREYVEIMDSQIKQNAILEFETKRLYIVNFMHYITQCQILDEPEMLKTFADRFINKLEPDLIDDAKNYVNFMLSFMNKDFDKALNYITLLEIPYVRLKVNLRAQKAMCLYETDNYEIFLNEYDSLRHFMNNNQFLNDSNKKMLNAHFSSIKRLFNLRQSFDEFEHRELRKLFKEIYTNSISWFDEKLDEVKKVKG
ncbi:MAG: hypothetical protein ABIY50_08940 [Ignavibacteria bacterium]